jgi:ribosomal protein S27AE
MKKEKMRCPECGIEMNQHAEKVDYTAALSKPQAVDPDFGGVVEEAHTCPECGKSFLREA